MNIYKTWNGETELKEPYCDCWDVYEFLMIHQETSKAWYIEMVGGAKYWLPKSKCKLAKGMLLIPRWLRVSIENENIDIDIENENREMELMRKRANIQISYQSTIEEVYNNWKNNK